MIYRKAMQAENVASMSGLNTKNRCQRIKL